MKKKGFGLLIVLFLTILTSSIANAYSDMPAGKKPIPVKIGLYLDDILSIDESEERMHYNATLMMQWRDSRLAYNKVIAGGDLKRYDTRASNDLLKKIWHPQIGFVGASGPRDVQDLQITVRDDGLVTWTETFSTTTNIKMDLVKFPFDQQNLTISLQPFVLSASDVQLKLMPQYTGVSSANHLQGWEITGLSAHVRNVFNNLYHKPFSHYMLHIQAKRLSNYYVNQLFFPIVLIVLLSFSVFWMLKNPAVNRVAISLTAVLTIVVFQWRVQTKLPRVDYHTFSDFFMQISFIVAASTVVATLILSSISNEKKCNRWANLFRIFYPVVYVLSLGVLVLHFF